ncbi:MAG: PTS ascorbate transporter subunit IIC [Oscillospiraceae bacterium]|nr:PTS ascorbate transporter subunit IIC [Oscillospiraceae bacterium]
MVLQEKNTKKQVPLRLSGRLYNDLARWAESDFRSVNGQIEYLLTECVKQWKKSGKYVSEEIDAPPDFDIENFDEG